MKAIVTRIGFVLLVWGFASAVRAQEWTRFRGPNGSGLGLATNLPARWDSYLWRTKLAGNGHSSPVLWGERLFVTSADRTSARLTLHCLRADDGTVAWQKDFPLPDHRLHANNTLASATPATDERRVYLPRVENGQLLLTALTLEGQGAWEFNAGPFKTEHGLGHSPITYSNLVVFSDDQDLPGRVLALDRESGRKVWERPRSSGRADYSTPCLLDLPGKEPMLIFNTQEDGMCGLNARDGSRAWAAERVLSMRSVSSPIVTGGLVIGSCGSGGGGNYVVALRPSAGGSGSPTTAYEIRRSAPYVVTPIAVGDLLFLWSDGGIVTCVDAATGQSIWQERVGGNFFGSPVFADGKLYGVSTTGEVVVLAAAREFKELGRVTLGATSHATPAVANGRIYFRTVNDVFAVGGR
jgi:outer membrane protein assembly factor BamB